MIAASPVELRDEIVNALDAGDLDSEDRDAIAALVAGPSPVPALVGFLGFAFGARDRLPAAWLQFGVRCGEQVEQHDFFGRGAEATQILDILRPMVPAPE